MEIYMAKLEGVTVVKEFQARAMNIMAGKENLVAEVIIIVTIRLQYFLTEFFSQVALKKTPQAMTGRKNNSNINMNMINNICTKETISNISSGDYL
jgi:hypothetical protein